MCELSYGNVQVWAMGIQHEPQPPTLCIQLPPKHIYLLDPPVSGPASPRTHIHMDLQPSRMSVDQIQPPSLHVPQNTAALAIRHKASHKHIEEKLSSYRSISLWVYEFMGPTRLISLLCVQLPKLRYSVENRVRVVGFGQ